jgi:hypothetical protein
MSAFLTLEVWVEYSSHLALLDFNNFIMQGVDLQPLCSLLQKLPHSPSASSSLGPDIFLGSSTLFPKTPKYITTY